MKLPVRGSISAADYVLRIEIAEEGLYRLTSKDFSDVNIDLATVDPATIAIYGRDGTPLPEDTPTPSLEEHSPIPILVETDGNGNPSGILFYAVGPVSWKYQEDDILPRHHLNPYITRNSYIVTIGGSASPTWQQHVPPLGAPNIHPASAPNYVVHERDSHNVIGLHPNRRKSGRDWVGEEFVVERAGTEDHTELSLSLPGLDKSHPLTGRIRYFHAGRRGGLNSGEAVFTLSQGTQTLGITRINDVADDNVAANYAEELFTFSLPSSETARFTINYKSFTPARGYIDWMELHYQRRLRAVNGMLTFSSVNGSGIAEYAAEGFQGGNLVALDVPDPASPQRIQPIQQGNGSFIFRDSLGNGGKARRYIVAEVEQAPQVDTIYPAAFGNLHGIPRNADLLIITHPLLKGSADEYAAYRNNQGELRAVPVTTEEIYTEYSNGNLDPTAIRNYIAEAYNSWQRPPRFILLLGDASYDYRNLTTGQDAMVPTYETMYEGYEYNVLWSNCTDDYYARISGSDGLVDLAVGRIPATADDEARIALEKIKRYESSQYQGPWQQRIILAADDNYPDSSETRTMLRLSEQLWGNAIPDWMFSEKLYLSTYPNGGPNDIRMPNATLALREQIERGALITNWIGHGNPNVWAHERLLEADKFVPALGNDTALTFVTALTCNFGYYDDPDERSGGELFLLHPGGGAVALLTGSRTTLDYSTSVLLNQFFIELFRRNEASGEFPTIGEALVAAKRYEQTELWTGEKFHIFGDPSLRLRIPRYRARVSTIDTVDVLSETARIGALAQVTLNGEILSPSGTEREENFNGHVVISLYDSQRRITVADENIEQIIERNGGLLYRGTVPVSNGLFSLTFRIPKDIAHDTTAAGLYVYAYGPEGDAAGVCRNILLFGIDTALVAVDADQTGPELIIYLDDPTFRSGDMVPPSPELTVELFDPSGLNTSGAGMGHSLQAWLDNQTAPIDLTDRFFPDPTDYQRGSAIYELTDLAPGEHRLRVRAWDIFNNPTEADIYFRIAEFDESTLDIADIYVYPSPTADDAYFLFRHNQNVPLQAQVDIFTPAGRKIRSIEAYNIVGRQGVIHWDGRDADGDKPANGVYYYRLRVRRDGNDGAETFEVIETLVVLR